MSAALALAPIAEATKSAAPSLKLVKNASPEAVRALAALHQMYGYFGSDRA